MNKYKTRDYSVELFRLFGSFIVIGVHTCLPVFQNNALYLNRLFMACCFADGVAMFWMITGFFLYSESSYGKLLRKLRDRTIIPMLCYGMFFFFFSSFCITGKYQVRTKQDYANLLYSLIRFRNVTGARRIRC